MVIVKDLLGDINIIDDPLDLPISKDGRMIDLKESGRKQFEDPISIQDKPDIIPPIKQPPQEPPNKDNRPEKSKKELAPEPTNLVNATLSGTLTDPTSTIPAPRTRQPDKPILDNILDSVIELVSKVVK
jgi:hypothetical protein